MYLQSTCSQIDTEPRPEFGTRPRLSSGSSCNITPEDGGIDAYFKLHREVVACSVLAPCANYYPTSRFNSLRYRHDRHTNSLRGSQRKCFTETVLMVMISGVRSTSKLCTYQTPCNGPLLCEDLVVFQDLLSWKVICPGSKTQNST